MEAMPLTETKVVGLQLELKSQEEIGVLTHALHLYEQWASRAYSPVMEQLAADMRWKIIAAVADARGDT